MSGPDALRIVGGSVHDPANGIDGQVRDVCIQGGQIVDQLPKGVPTLDARGMVVMPGGVDIHSHFASSSCNHARRLIPDEHASDPMPAPDLLEGEPPARSGTGGTGCTAATSAAACPAWWPASTGRASPASTW